MNVYKRIEDLMKQRDLTYYRLAQLSGLSQSTLNNMKTRGSLPSLYTLEQICKGLQISLSQFFMDETETCQCLNNIQLEILKHLSLLTPEQQKLILELVKNMNSYSTPEKKRGYDRK